MQVLPNEMHNGTTMTRGSVLWTAKGDDLPVHVRYSSAIQSYLLLAESAYTTISSVSSAVTPIPPHEPLPEEIAPIPGVDENPDTPPPPTISIPPYTWTQNSDSVTIAFFLPASLPKAALRIVLGSNDLSILIIDTGGSIATAKRLGLKVPSFTKKAWWDRIDASASFWTWDKEGDREYAAATSSSELGEPAIGVLTFYLEKGHEKTRWPHVFASAGIRPKDEMNGQPPDERDLDVPETLDPTELYAVREALEKYTTTLASGEDTSGWGLGHGAPSLSRKEIDDEVDDDIGRNVVVMWRKANDGSATLLSGEHEYPIDLLSHPIPLPLPDEEAKFLGTWSIVIKKGVDGLLFDCNDTPTGITNSHPPWKHEATFSALAFVLASKRDTRFTFHLHSKAVVALDSGAASPIGGGNAYIYHTTERGEDKWAKQAVLKVGGGTAGALLGVVGIPENKRLGQTKIVCLCERELVVIQGIV